MLKRDDGQKRKERRKTAGYAGVQVRITCLSWVAAVTNAPIRFLPEFRGAFMCVHGKAKRKVESLRTSAVWCNISRARVSRHTHEVDPSAFFDSQKV